MTPDRFWDIIAAARAKTEGDSSSADPAALKEVLDPLSSTEIQEFSVFFNEQLVALNHWDIWAVGYLLAGGMGDDSFHYFRSWIIGRGRACTEAVLANPESIAEYLEEVELDEELDNELLEYVALELLEGRGITEDLRQTHADDDPAGEPFDEDEDALAARFPNIAEMLFEEEDED